MKIVHVPGVEVGGQKHKIILEAEDGFTGSGGSFAVDATPFAEAVHTHTSSEISDLEALLSGKADVIGAVIAAASLSASTVTATSLSLGLSTGDIPYQGASGLTSNSTGLYWDSSNNRLGLHTNAPASGQINIKNLCYVNALASDATSGMYLWLNTNQPITQSGFGSSRGFTWISVLSSGTERLRLDWSAGNAIRWYAPGRMDFESAGQVFFSGTQFFMQAHTSVNRTGDASSTATQKDSYGLYLQHSGWTGSASTQRFALIRNKASTTANLDHRLAFMLNVSGGITSEGPEALSLNWYSSLGSAMVGVLTTSPSAALDVSGDSVRIRTAQTPATSGATGVQGEIAWDSNYIYVCVASNSWKRAALTGW